MRSSAVGVGFCRALPMSLMPSMTMTCVTPGWLERVDLEPGERIDAGAVGALAEDAIAADAGVQIAHLHRRGRRQQPPREDVRPPVVRVGRRAAPSVIESPKATMTPAASGASTSTRDNRNQLRVVATVGSFGVPA